MRFCLFYVNLQMHDKIIQWITNIWASTFIGTNNHLRENRHVFELNTHSFFNRVFPTLCLVYVIII